MPPAARIEPPKLRAHLAQQLEVGAAAGAVAVDRGADDVAHAGLGAARERLLRRQLRRLEPAGRAHDAACDVDRDDEPLVEGGDELPQRDRPERGRADDDTRDTGLGERHAHRRPTRTPPPSCTGTGAAASTDGARELDRRAAVACRAERDHVDERGSGCGSLPHERERIAGIDLDAVVVAPQEPDGPAVEDVHGRDDCELCSNVLAW